jgi:16S rRNA (cytosine967-C5)-methyltransferase
MLKVSRQDLIESLENDGLSVSTSDRVPESIEVFNLNKSLAQLESYNKGLFQVQDESSMLIGHILDPKPDEIIIDVCSAPGGKSTHIAELMENKGKIMSFDINKDRLGMLNENCQRLGINIIETIVSDARNIGEHIKEKADRILIDAPCTGLGVLRRRVEARWRRTPEQIDEFAKLQYEILESVCQYVKPNGVLVYCTCTIEPEENERVVEKFLESHPEFQIQSISPFLPDIADRMNIVSAEGYLKTYPHIHNIDGFFAVRMIHINSA